MHTCDVIAYYGFVGYEIITKEIKGCDPIIGMNTNISSHV
jgi:hypothetical protein